MAEKEYYLILPLLLYGLAITDLVNSWRSFLKEENRYLPYTATSLLLLELAFWNFFGLYHWVQVESYFSYIQYMRLLLAPLTFLLVVAVFTPEQDVTDLKDYFTRQMRMVFTLMAIFVGLHLMDGDSTLLGYRLAGIVLLLLTAATRKVWLVYAMVIFRAAVIIWTSLP